MKIPILISFFFLSLSASAQIPEGFPYVNKNNLEEGKIKSERTYTAESLFGYMNGGAELYLEYGFDRLVVSVLEVDDNEYKVEVYKMNTPEAAYGIYSVSVFRCDTSGLIKDYSCQTDYQIQVCKGQYYISIINDSGKPEAVGQGIELANKLVPLINTGSFETGAFLKDINLEEDFIKVTLIKGELGLFNGAYDWYDILQGLENYTGLVLVGQSQSVVVLEFNNNHFQAQFLERLGIRSQPEFGQEINIDQNTILTVISDVLVMIQRLR